MIRRSKAKYLNAVCGDCFHFRVHLFARQLKALDALVAAETANTCSGCCNSCERYKGAYKESPRRIMTSERACFLG